jgi:hypothetical protein
VARSQRRDAQAWRIQDLDAAGRRRRQAVEIDVLLSAVPRNRQMVGERTHQLDALLGLSRLHARMRGLYPD